MGNLQLGVPRETAAAPAPQYADSVVRYLIFLARMLIYGATRRIETGKSGMSRRIRRATAGVPRFGRER